MNPFAILSIMAVFAAFGCFVWAFIVRMKPSARRARFAFYGTAAAAFVLFLLYGAMRNFY
ncbi:MAG: hypothetical protein DBY25_06085 [Clostridiales bacterium]|nr:MAG: hypothetical protein DBY25_06085 [Clostridiales bacterium]